MNPLGFVIIGLGIIMIIVGVKGSQHSIIDALTGKKPSTASTTAATAAGSTATSQPGSQPQTV